MVFALGRNETFDHIKELWLTLEDQLSPSVKLCIGNRRSSPPSLVSPSSVTAPDVAEPNIDINGPHHRLVSDSSCGDLCEDEDEEGADEEVVTMTKYRDWFRERGFEYIEADLSQSGVPKLRMAGRTGVARVREALVCNMWPQMRLKKDEYALGPALGGAMRQRNPPDALGLDVPEGYTIVGAVHDEQEDDDGTSISSDGNSRRLKGVTIGRAEDGEDGTKMAQTASELVLVGGVLCTKGDDETKISAAAGAIEGLGKGSSEAGPSEEASIKIEDGTSHSIGLAVERETANKIQSNASLPEEQRSVPLTSTADHKDSNDSVVRTSRNSDQATGRQRADYLSFGVDSQEDKDDMLNDFELAMEQMRAARVRAADLPDDERRALAAKLSMQFLRTFASELSDGEGYDSSSD
mmetsp:Transcript_41670/g.67594  ORF Transcript_41670/g.67594 Transcript_41670/m.67594 type:complete len:409 (+) Transcript_41670:312-1538(+)